MQTRADIQHGLLEFLAGTASATRPRAALVTGDAGVGKSFLLEQLHVGLLALGVTDVVVVDDADHLDSLAIERLALRLTKSPGTRLLASMTAPTEQFLAMVDRVCDRRHVQLGALSDEEARELLALTGVEPWTLRAHVAMVRSGNVPRRLIDEAIVSSDIIIGPDTSFSGSGWSRGAARRLELVLTGQGAELDAFLAACEAAAAAESDGPDGMELADVLAVLANVARWNYDFERAVQLAERATTVATDPLVKIWASAIGAASRAHRGEAQAMLSLHALATAARRAGAPVLEASIWEIVSFVAGTCGGDVASSRRAAIRSAVLADEAGAWAIGSRARLLIAALHVASGQPANAVPYYSEIERMSETYGWHTTRLDTLVWRSRALLALGRNEEAVELADQVLEIAVDDAASAPSVVEAKVVSARAHAASGAMALVDAVLGEASDVAACAERCGPEFWIALEGVRIYAAVGQPEDMSRWSAALAGYADDGHGGAVRAARAEIDAWMAKVAGSDDDARRLAQLARELWSTAECHDELSVTDVLVAVEEIVEPEPQADPAIFEVLTKREREIARLVAAGMTNPEIATELVLSPRTVEHHVASILRKLELPSRRALVLGKVA